MFSTQHIDNTKLILLILSYFISGYQCACYGGGVRCYTVYPGNFKYAEALSGCQGGHSLVEVTSLQIQTDLVAELVGQTDDYFIGLTDDVSEGTYVWESGAALTWENWSTFHTNSRGQNCVALSWVDGFKWKNKNCKNKAAYICSNNNAGVPETTTTSTTPPTTTVATTDTPTTTAATTDTPTTTVETTTTPTTTAATTDTPTTTQTTTDTPTTTVETTTTPTTVTTSSVVTSNGETTESIDKNTTKITHNSTLVPIVTTPQISEELQNIYRELDVITKTAEANRLRRTKISVVDDRPSSQTIGYFGIIILSAVGFIIFILDIPNYRRDFKRIKRNICGS